MKFRTIMAKHVFSTIIYAFNETHYLLIIMFVCFVDFFFFVIFFSHLFFFSLSLRVCVIFEIKSSHWARIPLPSCNFPGSKCAHDVKQLIVIVKRAALIHQTSSSTSCRPGRTRGLCAPSCRTRSKSCRRPRCSCAQCVPSCCNYNSSALRSARSRCRPLGNCEQCDRFCCSCSSSSPVPANIPMRHLQTNNMN